MRGRGERVISAMAPVSSLCESSHSPLSLPPTLHLSRLSPCCPTFSLMTDPTLQVRLQAVGRAMNLITLNKDRTCWFGHRRGKSKGARWLSCLVCKKLICADCERAPDLLNPVIICVQCYWSKQEQVAAAAGWAAKCDDASKARWNRLDVWHKTYKAILATTELGRKDSTVSQYGVLVNAYAKWARAMGFPALPAIPSVLQTFFCAKRMGLVESERGKVAVTVGTIVNYNSAIAAWHQCLKPMLGIEYDPTADPSVTALVLTEKRKYDKRLSERSAVSVRAMALFLSKETEQPVEIHEQLTAAIAYLGMLRVSELLGLTYSDREEDSDLAELPGGLGLFRLRLQATKTSARGEEVTKMIANKVAPGAINFGALYRKYQRHVGCVNGKQLLLKPGNGRRKLLTRQDVTDIARKIMREAHEDATEVSSHSFRRGGAAWLYASGMPLPAVMEVGLWKSSAVLSYLGSREDRIKQHLLGMRSSSLSQATRLWQEEKKRKTNEITRGGEKRGRK